jgi:hypothetical protein
VLALPWQLESTLEKRQRLQRMGIQTPAEFRSALRELQNLRQERASLTASSSSSVPWWAAPMMAWTSSQPALQRQRQPLMRPRFSQVWRFWSHTQVWRTLLMPFVNRPAWSLMWVSCPTPRRELLEAKGYNLVGSEFLELQGKQYDRIIMNPPFSKGATFSMCSMPMSLLRPGGRLVAIMGEGAFFQSNKRAEFREWLDDLARPMKSCLMALSWTRACP